MKRVPYVLFITIGISSSAYSRPILENDLLIGRRWYAQSDSTGTDTYHANEIIFSSRVPLNTTIPLSIGPSLSYDRIMEDENTSEASIWELGLEAKAQTPLASDLDFYGKARYVLFSQGAYKNSDNDFKTKGVHLAIGLQYAVKSDLKIMGELALGIQTWGDRDSRQKAFNSNACLVGLNYAF